MQPERRQNWSRWDESNVRQADYKSATLPLSYSGKNHWAEGSFANTNASRIVGLAQIMYCLSSALRWLYFYRRSGRRKFGSSSHGFPVRRNGRPFLAVTYPSLMPCASGDSFRNGWPRSSQAASLSTRLAGREGFEPPTNTLTGCRTTVVLSAKTWGRQQGSHLHFRQIYRVLLPVGLD